MSDHWDRGLPPAGDPRGWLIAALCLGLLAMLAAGIYINLRG
ncbi:hypothetical protein [Xanthomonas translucens]|nr:hypothetical protein [Xanthomonas translucens]